MVGSQAGQNSYCLYCFVPVIERPIFKVSAAGGEAQWVVEHRRLARHPRVGLFARCFLTSRTCIAASTSVLPVQVALQAGVEHSAFLLQKRCHPAWGLLHFTVSVLKRSQLIAFLVPLTLSSVLTI